MNGSTFNFIKHCRPQLYPSPYEVYGIKVVLAMHVLASVTATLGNALVGSVIIGNHRLRSPTNYFILSLSITDGIVGAIGQPMFVYLFWRMNMNKPSSCVYVKIQYFFGSVSCGASGLLLCLVSIERWLSICKPFFHNRYISEKRVVSMIINAWVTSTIITSISFSQISKLAYASILLASFFAVLLIIIPCYVLIYRTATRQLRQIRTELSKFSDEHKLKQRKSAATILYVVIGFLCCWGPYFITNFIWSLNEKENDRKPRLLTTYYYALTLGYLNSCINPFLYTFNNKELKNGILKLLAKIFGRRCIQECYPATRIESFSDKRSSVVTRPTLLPNSNRQNSDRPSSANMHWTKK